MRRRGKRKREILDEEINLQQCAESVHQSLSKVPVLGIEHDTFNTGHSKYASPFKTSRRNVANFVQQTLHDEGYLVAKTIKTGVEQTVAVPPSIPETTDQSDISSPLYKGVPAILSLFHLLRSPNCDVVVIDDEHLSI